MRCEFAHDGGAYVLGALTPAERAAFERHLATCPTCREEVAELAVLPGLLGRLDSATAEQIAQDADAVESTRLPRLLEAAGAVRRRDTRRRRWQAVAVVLAAACLAGLAAFGVSAIRGAVQDNRPPVAMLPMVSTVESSKASADIGFTTVASGTRFWMHCKYDKVDGSHKPYQFRLVAYGTDGKSEQVASWMAGSGTDLWVNGYSRYGVGDLERLEVQARDGRAVLVYTVA